MFFKTVLVSTRKKTESRETTQAIAGGLETCWLRLGWFKVTVTSQQNLLMISGFRESLR